MTSHNEIREIMLTEKMLKPLPAQPAVYAIFIRQEEGPETDFCIFTGCTINLKHTIARHFFIFEPNLELRRYMSDETLKYLRYETFAKPDYDRLLETQAKWAKKYKPKIKPL